MKHWKTTKSEYLLRNKWLTVRLDTCETSDGVLISPYYVLEYSDWVHIIALDSNCQILITQQYRHAVKEVCTEIPCGIIEHGELPEMAAHRELHEETGCTSKKLKFIGEFYANPATHTNRVHCFLAYDTTISDNPHQDDTEEITFKFLPIEKVFELIEKGTFSQGLHIASLMLGLRKSGLLSET